MPARHLLFCRMLLQQCSETFAWCTIMNLRQARQSRGLTQEQLARKIGVDQAAISRMENGKQRITLELLGRMAEALGMDPRDLFPDREAA